MRTTLKNLFIPALCAALMTAAACAPQKTVRKSTPETETPEAKAGAETGAPDVESGEANIRGTEFQTISDLVAVHFAYDAYALDAEARDLLKKNSEYLRSHPDLEVLVTGYCDERGTIAYNLALGQRRAKAVRDYYIRLGISGKSVATLSYGKERPVCSEHTDDCWAKNRRGETTIRARTASTPPRGDEDQSR